MPQCQAVLKSSGSRTIPVCVKSAEKGHIESCPSELVRLTYTHLFESWGKKASLSPSSPLKSLIASALRCPRGTMIADLGNYMAREAPPLEKQRKWAASVSSSQNESCTVLMERWLAIQGK